MKSINQLDTPTLLLDIDKFERNLEDMILFANQTKLKIRPHFKTHKSVHIAKRQIEAGATGITVAKVSEAEVAARGGISDILIAYPISSPQKIKRVIHLLEQGVNIKIAIDSDEQANMLQEAMESADKQLEVWIKVNSGLNRCGVEPGQEVLTLASNLKNLSNLSLKGIFTHAGHAYAATTQEQIKKIAIEEAKTVVESANLCEQNGIPIPIRSVGSTPTYKLSGSHEGVTEVRPGNAIFYDAMQAGLGVTTIKNCAIDVLSSVVGVYQHSRIVLDAGSKSLSLDKGAHGNETVKGFGFTVNHPELTIDRLSEEHGIASIHEKTKIKRNDKLRIIPNHACTVVNLFNSYTVHRNGHVLDIWNIDGRGCNQ